MLAEFKRYQDSINWSLLVRKSKPFIFIHINKTGGSSIETALNLKLEHSTAKSKIDQVGLEHWKRCFTFAFIRNPYDRVVSHYHYRVQTNQTNLAVESIDFNKWVKLAYGEKDREYYNNPLMFMPCLDWIADENQKILISKTCRFEKLHRDFYYVCSRIGIKPIKLLHLKKSSRDDYQRYYNDESIEIISSHFAKDLERFGYGFDAVK